MMGNFANLRIGSKLMLAFGVLILAFGAMLFITLERFVKLQAAEVQQFRQGYARLSEVKELRINLIAQRAELLLAMNAGAGSELEQHEAELQRGTARNDKLLQHLREGLAQDQEAKAIFDPLDEARTAFAHARETELLPLIRSGRPEEAFNLYRGVQSARLGKINELGQRLVELTDKRVELALEKSSLELQAQRELLLWLGLLLVAACAVLAWLLSRHIGQPLARLTGWAEQISVGEIPQQMNCGTRQDEVGRLGQAFTRMGHYLQNLAGKAEALARGELPEGGAPLSEHDVLGQAFARMGQYFQALAGRAEALARGELQDELRPTSERDVLGLAFATMIGNLRSLVQDLHEGISVLATASEEILAVTTQVATSTQETATAISEITTTVEEVKQTAVLAGNKSQGVAESTERTRQVAQGGRQAVEEALAGMQQIREQMQAVAESIMRLGEQSQAIGEIVASVGDLAEQSNLLGVNASIEAVKAGEVGKGFSVVAQEVKTLAEQSKQATAQVRGILGEIQKAMSKAVLQAEQGSKTVESGYQRAELSGEAIRTLGNSVEESSEVALQIAATSQQQMIGMDQIGSAMENIRQASQDNVGGTRQVDLAARNLHQLGLKLKSLAGQFKL